MKPANERDGTIKDTRGMVGLGINPLAITTATVKSGQLRNF